MEMGFLQAIFLGLLQGLTEFLPVSSSGHLALAQSLFAELKGTPMLFDVVLHVGTLFAVCAAFWKDIVEILREFGRMITGLVRRRHAETVPPARRMVILIVVGTLPVIVTGLLLSGMVETAMGNPLVVGLLLCATGILLLLADRLPKGKKNEKNALVTDALIVGACQAIAILPGLSRSGATITGGLFRKFDRSFAVRFSFLLSLPAVLGATVLELIKALGSDADAEAAVKAAQGGYEVLGVSFGICLIGMLVAAVVGYFAIVLVRRLVAKGRFGGMAYYCLALGILAVLISLGSMLLGGSPAASPSPGVTPSVTPTLTPTP